MMHKVSAALKGYAQKKKKPLPAGAMDSDVAADSGNEYPAPAQKKAASAISKYFKGR